ncbi:NADP-dependent oxidoreductase [Paraburkholderia sp. GAS42]|uniref:NADP-dependent oxidoreductase n=1 Tax=Paraburkholderia sp. GAS42 TaxID=3035135 RepID=UPI003D1C006B
MSDKSQTMRAVQLSEWGRADTLKLVDVPRPELVATEVLVKVKAVGLNPIDPVTIDGGGYMNFLTLPYIPGWDFAGVVEEVGYGTTRFKVGDEVYGMPWFPRPGNACAEYLTAPSRHIALKAKNITFEEAAGLPLAGLTAYQMIVDGARVKKGDKVLINGAAGGAGHLAVQIAKALGAHVTASASTSKLSFLKELGADRVVDYTKVNVEDEVSGMDSVIELVGQKTCIQMLKTLRKGGVLVSAHHYLVPGLAEEAAKLGVRDSWYLVEPDYTALEQMTALIESGKMKIKVSEVFAFEDAPKALYEMAQRHSTGVIITSKKEDDRHSTGKMVLKL